MLRSLSNMPVYRDMKATVRLLFILCCPFFTWAQNTAFSSTSSTVPSSIKWYQINTEHVRILFPQGFNEQAQRVVNMMEHLRDPEATSLGTPPSRKISIVLHNYSSVSNGFVAQAPWRSEFFTMPPQNYSLLGTNEWLTLLSSHEYRHMVQFSKSKTGLGKIVYYLFGELFQSAVAFAAVPQWFWEGDAVAVETAFTQSGRGRIPRFDLIFRTNLLEGRNFDYHKQYLRSYKHNIPNHYVLGYHMVAFLRKKTNNPHIWSNITRQAWSAPFIPFTFSNAIRKETGLYVQDLYAEMIADLKKEWLAQWDKTVFTPFEKINNRALKAGYTDYNYPNPLDDGSILAVKSGIGEIPHFITISPDGTEHKKFTPGLINDAGMLSTEQNKIVWNEYHYDLRWQTRSYSVIKGYDLLSKTLKTITKRSRYASAALSPDGLKIATVETTSAHRTNLVVLDYETGKEISRADNFDNHFIITPRWNHDGKHIVFISLSEQGKTITRYNIDSGTVDSLFFAGHENINHPVPYKRYILYNSPFTGIDNIYALDTVNKTRFQVTSDRYGAYNPAVSSDGTTMYYSHQTKDGLDIASTPFSPHLWVPIDSLDSALDGVYGKLLATQEANPDLMSHVPSKTHLPKKYHRAQGMFNPHTWGIYTNPSLTTLDVGVLLQDVLSTTTLNMGYRYNVSEKTGLWRVNFSYQGFYPILDVEFTRADRSVVDRYMLNGEEKNVQFDWKEVNIKAGIKVPLITTRSKYRSGVSVGNYIGITHVEDFRNSENGTRRYIPIPTKPDQVSLFRSYIDKGTLLFNHFTLSAYRQLKTSRRDIYSPWGQYFEINLRSTLSEKNYNGRQMSALAMLHFPGVLPHHSLWGYAAYQYTLIEEKLTNYLFRSSMPVPRGHRVNIFQNYYAVSANYTFPILYPDWALGPIVNLQRVWTTVFVDYASGESKVFETGSQYTSFGGELRFDLNIMRLLQKINLGVRYAYGIERRASTVEFIIGNIGFL